MAARAQGLTRNRLNRERRPASNLFRTASVSTQPPEERTEPSTDAALRRRRRRRAFWLTLATAMLLPTALQVEWMSRGGPRLAMAVQGGDGGDLAAGGARVPQRLSLNAGRPRPTTRAERCAYEPWNPVQPAAAPDAAPATPILDAGEPQDVEQAAAAAIELAQQLLGPGIPGAVGGGSLTATDASSSTPSNPPGTGTLDPPPATPPVIDPPGSPSTEPPILEPPTHPPVVGPIDPGLPDLPPLPTGDPGGPFLPPTLLPDAPIRPADSVDPVRPTAPVPEPSSWVLLILGFGAVGAGLRRRSTAAQ